LIRLKKESIKYKGDHMDRHKSELLFIGGGMLLAPIAGCGLALPLYMLTNSAICSILLGTVLAMATFLGGCWIHINQHGLPTEGPTPTDQSKSEQPASTTIK
jgi:hypothetical protein